MTKTKHFRSNHMDYPWPSRIYHLLSSCHTYKTLFELLYILVLMRFIYKSYLIYLRHLFLLTKKNQLLIFSVLSHRRPANAPLSRFAQ